MSLIHRRQFLQMGMAGTGLMLLPRWTWGDSTTEDPHFFIQIHLLGGIDPGYMFDGRSLAMTAAGKKANYLAEEPTLWTGSNGGTCLATSLTEPLRKFRDHFSILNGVTMAPGFDGHPQNLDYFYTGSSFGGESFLPHFNLPRTGYHGTAIDTVMNGPALIEFSNSSGTVPMSPESMVPVATLLQDLPDLARGDELAEHIRSRLVAASSLGSGRLANSSAQMLSALDQVSSLRAQLLKLGQLKPSGDAEAQFVQFLSGVFRNSVARSAFWMITGNFDAHDPSTCRDARKIIGDTLERIARIFQALDQTAFDEHRSMLDVTTIVVSSEFGRTMRQIGVPFDQTGTDHNPLSNSVLIGGRGIRGGMVIGASDFVTADETLSGAHLNQDAEAIKVMGRPFDFSALRPRQDLPAIFEVSDYLNISNVVNTLYSLFGVPANRYRTMVRNGPPAPILSGLLS